MKMQHKQQTLCPHNLGYKATPCTSTQKTSEVSFTKVNLSFRSVGCKQKEVKNILLMNNKLKI